MAIELRQRKLSASPSVIVLPRPGPLPVLERMWNLLRRGGFRQRQRRRGWFSLREQRDYLRQMERVRSEWMPMP